MTASSDVDGTAVYPLVEAPLAEALELYLCATSCSLSDAAT